MSDPGPSRDASGSSRTEFPLSELNIPKAPLASSPSQGSLSPKNEGNWLCDAGPYARYIDHRAGSQPAFQEPDPGNSFCPLRNRRARVHTIDQDGRNPPRRREFVQFLEPPSEPNNYNTENSSNSSKVKQPETQDPSKSCGVDGNADEETPVSLQKYFENAKTGLGHHRVTVVEGLRREVVKILGEHYGMDPSFFLIQERKGTTFNYNEYIENPFLPSLLKPGLAPAATNGEKRSDVTSYCIRSYELWSYNGEHVKTLESVRYRCQVGGDLTVWCSETGRPVIWYDWRYQRGPRKELLLVVPRKLSVWIKHHESGGSDSKKPYFSSKAINADNYSSSCNTC